MAIDFSELNEVLFPNKDKGDFEEIFKNFASPSGKKLIRNLGEEISDVKLKKLCTKLCNEKKVNGKVVVSVERSEDLFYRLKKLSELLKKQDEYKTESSCKIFVKNLDDSYNDWESTRSENDRARLKFVDLAKRVRDCLFPGKKACTPDNFEASNFENTIKEIKKLHTEIKVWAESEYWTALVGTPEAIELGLRKPNIAAILPVGLTDTLEGMKLVKKLKNTRSSARFKDSNSYSGWRSVYDKYSRPFSDKEGRVAKIVKLFNNTKLKKIVDNMASLAKESQEAWYELYSSKLEDTSYKIDYKFKMKNKNGEDEYYDKPKIIK